MAIFTPGPAVGQISGRVGGSVFSHNRGGPYIRNGTIPVTSTTPEAIAAKTRLSTVSTAWKNLTDAQRRAWTDWAVANPVTNRLGHSITLPANAAYISLNTRIAAAALTQIDVPPITAAPEGLATLTQSADIGVGDFDLDFTPTPLGAAEYLWIQCAVTNSTAIENVNNLLRFVGISAAAQATGFDHQSLVEARLGTLTAGQTVHTFASVFDGGTGLLSQPLRVSTVVTDT